MQTNRTEFHNKQSSIIKGHKLDELLNTPTIEELSEGTLYSVKLKIVSHRLNEKTNDCWILLDTTDPKAKDYKALAVHYRGHNISFFESTTVDVIDRVSKFIKLQSEKLGYTI